LFISLFIANAICRISSHQPQAQLRDPREVGLLRDASEVRIADLRVGRPKDRRVKPIDRFNPELVV
jgi:hypothetical protein